MKFRGELRRKSQRKWRGYVRVKDDMFKCVEEGWGVNWHNGIFHYGEIGGFFDKLSLL